MQVNDTPRKPRYAALETQEPVSKRTLVSRVVLGVVAVALLAGMVIQFTPNLGGGGAGAQSNGKTIMTVNGLPVTERDLERNRSGSQLFSLADTSSAVFWSLTTICRAVMRSSFL